MIVAAERARAYATFTPRCSISARRAAISLERPRSNSAIESWAAPDSATHTPAAIKIVPVVKRSASRVVSAVVKGRIVVMPVESPMTPSPSKAAEPSDSKADSGIRIPSRPSHDGISVNQPRIIGRDIHHIGLGRLNVDIRAILFNDFVLRVLKSAGLFRFVAHHLYRIHQVLLLVVVSVTQR